jgi:drug/metabolite transporter (DMT)-like permease
VVSAETFAAIPPATLGLLRLLLGVGALATFALLRGESLGWANAPKGAVLRAGVAVAASILLQFAGTALTSAVEGSIVTMATPVFVLIFGRLLEGIRVPRQAWLGIALAAVGVAVLALRSSGAEGLAADASASRLLGIAMLIGGGAAWALFSSLGRPIVAAVGARNAVTLSAGLAIPMMLPFVVAELAIGGIDLAAATTPSTLLAVLYLGVGATSIGWSCWYRGYAAAPPRLSAGVLFLQPLVAAALGVGLLNEALDGGLALGALFLLGGVALISFERVGTAKRLGVRS